MLIGITKKMRDKFKYIEVLDQVEKPEEIFSWHASHFIYQRKTGLHIMNNQTRYSVVLYDVKKKEILDIDRIFRHQLKNNLMDDGLDELKIQKYFKDLGEISFIKTSDRSILGQLNDSFYHLEADIYSVGTIMAHDLDYINSRSNELPMMTLEKKGYNAFPNKAMIKELNERY